MPQSISREKFNRFTIAVDDFEDALKYLNAAAKFDDMSGEHEGLLIAAVICYARPFSFNEKKGQLSEAAPSIQWAEVAPTDSRFLELHDRLIEFRNKAVAHSEFKYYPVTHIEGSNLISQGRFKLSNEGLDLKLFSELAEEMRKNSGTKSFVYVLEGEKAK